MRACVLLATGGLDHVAIAEIPPPRPEGLGPGDVRIRLRAAALNHLDLFVVRGLPGVECRFPHVLGADGAGEVAEVGSDVARVQPGDRVLINPGISDYTCEFCRRGEHSWCVTYRILGEHLPGTLAQEIVVPEVNVAAIPAVDPPITWPEAAAFSLVTLTAWRMVVTRAAVQPGDTVLVWGIGGGVALAALRIAKQRGARVFVTSSSDAKLEAARGLGAEGGFNHARQDVAREIRAHTRKRGVDVVIDNVGEATWESSLRVLAKGGRLVTCGATTGPRGVTDMRRLFWNHLTIMGSTMGNAAEYEAVVAELGAGRLRPLIDRVFPLAEARAAFGRLERGGQLGKIAVEIA